MSQENVEAARRTYAALSKGDLEALLASLTEDVEFMTAGVFPGLDRVYRGHDGVRKFWKDFRGSWVSLRYAVDRFRESGNRVVALYRFEAIARDGLPVHREGANVITFRDGLAQRIESFGDWETALEAVGLSE
jgi:ketosteroid isomerase-like protein